MADGQAYSDVGRYSLKYISPKGESQPFAFNTLVSSDGRIAWEPHTEQQHLNPQYRTPAPSPDYDLFSLPVDEAFARISSMKASNPVTIHDVRIDDVTKMVCEALSFKEKKTEPLETILAEHGRLIERIYYDLVRYKSTQH